MTARRKSSALARKRNPKAGGPLADLGRVLRERLEEAGSRLLSFGRVVRGVRLLGEDRWGLLLEPCGHEVVRPRRGQSYTLRVAICEVCEHGKGST